MPLIENPPTLPEPNAFVCTPVSLMQSVPCLQCLSDHELLAALLGILLESTGETVAEVMKASSCFTCLSKKQMKQAFVTLMGNNVLGEATSLQGVLKQMACLRCANDTQLYAAILYEFCKLSINTGDERD